MRERLHCHYDCDAQNRLASLVAGGNSIQWIPSQGIAEAPAKPDAPEFKRARFE